MPKEKIPAAVRSAVWLKYIGEKYNAICFCCNSEPLTRVNYECGHILSEKHGGKVHINNLRPICSACNKSVGAKNMEEFMEKYGLVKNKNWDGIDNTSDESDDPKKKQIKKATKNNSSEESDSQAAKNMTVFLNIMTVRKIRQICIMFDISIGGTKGKLIEKIINNSHTIKEILNRIDDINNKKYMIQCYGTDICNQAHIYFTNKRLTDTSITEKIRHIDVDSKIECCICKNISYMKEHDNEFYKK